MTQGAAVFLSDGFAEIEFTDPAVRGKLIGQLLVASRESGVRIRVDSGGKRRRYIVPEHVAQEAHLLDEGETSPQLELPLVKDEQPVEESQAVDTPAMPPRPGFKGGTRAAWTAYAQALGIKVTKAMSLQDIYQAAVPQE